MKKIYRAFCVTLIISLSFISFSAQAKELPSYQKIVFFGDSLTDNGNLYLLTSGQIPKSPPYFKGRFSNGYLWADNVASHYQQSQIPPFNFAMAGMTVLYTEVSEEREPYTLVSAVNQFLNHMPQFEKSKTLYIIWAGANDYLPGPSNIDAITTSVVASIRNVMETLISHGADNFLIINLPDLSKTPQTRPLDKNELFRSLTTLHNIKLHENVDQLAGSFANVNIHLFNVNKVFDDLIEKTEEVNKEYQTHITNTKDACWQGGHLYDGNGLNRELQKDEVKLCADPDEYVFWDRLHPTKVAHDILGRKLIVFINQHYRIDKM